MKTTLAKALRVIAVCLLVTFAAAQDKSGRPAPEAAPSPVTINMAPGITQQQADAILQELRSIHQLLDRQLQAPPVRPAAAPVPPPPSDRVKMSLVQSAYSIGREDAPVTLVEFADYQCPFCKRFHSEAFAELKKNYIDTGKVRFISRDLPLEFHANAIRAALVARCAGEQGKFWETRDALIASGADVSTAALLQYAKALRLNPDRFQSCVANEKYKPEIQRDAADANGLQISGTPSFVLGKTTGGTVDGVRLVGAMPYSTFEAAIKQAIEGQ